MRQLYPSPRRTLGHVMGEDVGMGSSGERERKPHEHLPKVPRGEEPNSIPLAGLGGSSGPNPGREGHDHDHHGPEPRPGRFGRWLLRSLGMRGRRVEG